MEYSVYSFTYSSVSGGRWTARILAESQEDALKTLYGSVKFKIRIESRGLECNVHAISHSVEKKIIDKYSGPKISEKRNIKQKEGKQEEIQEERQKLFKKEEKDEEGEFICSDCGFKSKSKMGLDSHIRQKHA